MMHLYKKRILIILLTCIMTFIVTGCSKTVKGEDENRFNERTDYQYMYFDSSKKQCNIQKGEGGYFFMKSGFLYKIDAKTKKVQPVCDKDDCKHDNSVDMEHMKECGAYLKDYKRMDRQIQYCDGWIYYRIVKFYEKKNEYVSEWYGIKTDGSGEVKKIDQDKGQSQETTWLVHRGNLFYLKYKFVITSKKKEFTQSRKDLSVYKVSVKGETKKEVIYQTPKGFDDCGMNPGRRNFAAYGNYLYFSEKVVDSKKIHDRDANVEEFHYCFQIDSNKIKKIDGLANKNLYNILPMKDYLLFFDFMEDNKNDTCVFEVYQSDFSCEKMRKIKYKGEESSYLLISDGKYLYKDNYDEVKIYDQVNDETPLTHKVVVYNKDFKVVDKYHIPRNDLTMTVPGDDKYMFRIKGTEWNYSVYSIDKSQIGSLNNKNIKEKEIYKYVGDWGGK